MCCVDRWEYWGSDWLEVLVSSRAVVESKQLRPRSLITAEQSLQGRDDWLHPVVPVWNTPARLARLVVTAESS